MEIYDRLPLAGTRRTRDGYLVADARVARTGIQLYRGSELGKPDIEVVRVYRPETEVFSDASMASYAHKPVTRGHPKEPVNSRNHKELAVGIVGDEIRQEGKFIRVPLMLTDEAAIEAVEAGTNELSMGYKSSVSFVDGVTPDGEPYDAIQTDIEINHLAIVSKARGGSELKIGDIEDGGPAMPDKTTQIVRDGLSVSLAADQAQILQKLFGDADGEMEKMKAEMAKMKTALEEKDGKIAQLESDAKKAADEKPDEKALDKRADERAKMKKDAAAIIGDGFDMAGLSSTEIMRAVVAKTLSEEQARNMSDAAIEGAYSVAVQAARKLDPVRRALSDGLTVHTQDAWADIIPAKGA